MPNFATLSCAIAALFFSFALSKPSSAIEVHYKQKCEDYKGDKTCFVGCSPAKAGFELAGYKFAANGNYKVTNIAVSVWECRGGGDKVNSDKCYTKWVKCGTFHAYPVGSCPGDGVTRSRRNNTCIRGW